MADPKYTASARVTLTVEVDVRSSWGTDCTVAQVHKQAEDEARGTIEHMIADARKDHRRLRLVGVPKVEAVIAAKEN